VGVAGVVIILAFFGRKDSDCSNHQARYNYYVDQLNQINQGVLSSVAGALTGHTVHLQEILQDEGFYINQNCKIIGMSAAEGNTTNDTGGK
jgi:hypothetical protein